MKTVSRLGSATARSATLKPAASAAAATRATRRVPPRTWSSRPSSVRRVRVTPVISSASARSSASRSPVVFTVTIVSAPTVRLSFAGVSRARTLPWSMIATRPQSRSASSM